MYTCSDTDGLQAPFSMAMSKAMCSAMESVYAGGDSGDALKMVTDKMMSVVFADSIVQKMTDLPSPYALNIADAMQVRRSERGGERSEHSGYERLRRGRNDRLEQTTGSRRHPFLFTLFEVAIFLTLASLVQVGMKRTMGDGGVDGFGLAAMSAALAFPNTLFDEPKQPQVGRSHAGSSHVMVESAPPVIEESESSEEEEEEIAVEASKFEDGYFDENEVKEIMRRQSVDMKLEWDSKKAAATATANAKLKEQNDEMNRMRREHLDDVVDLEQLYDKLDIAEKELKKTRVEKENADYFAQHELDRLQRELEVEKEKAKQQGSEGFFSSESQLLHKKQQSHLQQQKQAMEQQKQAMEQQKQAMERQKQEIALQRPVSAGGVPAGIFLAEKCVQQGWVIAYTPQGKAYFQNNRTKQTSWTSPKPEQEAAAPAAGTGCPNRNNPHHSCNAYCLKTFGGGGGAGGGGDGGEWACQICTLSNPAKARFCTVCGKAKGTHTINTPFA